MVDRLFPDLSRFRGLFRLLCWEGALAMAYETWVGPVYLSGLAGELGIGLGLVSVLAAIPWIGASGQVMGAWAFDRSPSVSRYVLGVATAARALWLVPLFLAAFWGLGTWRSGHDFPVSRWFLVTAVCACVSSLFASASANAWMYWMKTLVPAGFQGRFFGYRQRFTTAAFVLASLAAAFLTGWAPAGFRIGATVQCGLALLAAFLSLCLLSKVRDVRIERVPGEKPRSFRQIVEGPLRDPSFRRLLLFGALFNGALQLAASYFPYYFTKELRIPMSSVAVWTSISNLGCFLSVGYWGRRADRSRSPYEVLWITGNIVAFAPLWYVIRDARLVQLIAPAEYLLNGLAWAGFLLAQTKLLMRASPRGQSAAYFSVYAAACGLSGALCTFIGGQIGAYGGFQLLFVFAFVCRITALWIFCPRGGVLNCFGSNYFQKNTNKYELL